MYSIWSNVTLQLLYVFQMLSSAPRLSDTNCCKLFTVEFCIVICVYTATWTAAMTVGDFSSLPASQHDQSLSQM